MHRLALLYVGRPVPSCMPGGAFKMKGGQDERREGDKMSGEVQMDPSCR